MKQGIDYAWELLAACDPWEVQERADVAYSVEDQAYTVEVLGYPILVDMAARTLVAKDPESEYLLTKTAYFSRLSILRYLLDAQRIPPTGRLVKPEELKSGQIYLKGSHLLPLDPVAGRFATDPEGFRAQAARFGGEQRDLGDTAIELRPFPRVPVTLILWLEDEEFPARTSLLFDETCEQQLPPDILWSVAMICALVMLKR